MEQLVSTKVTEALDMEKDKKIEVDQSTLKTRFFQMEKQESYEGNIISTLIPE